MSAWHAVGLCLNWGVQLASELKNDTVQVPPPSFKLKPLPAPASPCLWRAFRVLIRVCVVRQSLLLAHVQLDSRLA